MHWDRREKKLEVESEYVFLSLWLTCRQMQTDADAVGWKQWVKLA